MSTSQIALLASVQQFLDLQHGLYIDGAPCAAQSENRLTVWDPATGQAIAYRRRQPGGCRPGGDVRLARFCRSPLGRAHPG